MTRNQFLYGNAFLPLLWTGGGRSRIFRLPRILTPEERVLEDIDRGGFPLFRKESCDPRYAPAAVSVHAYLEKLIGRSLADSMLKPRPAGQSACGGGGGGE